MNTTKDKDARLYRMLQQQLKESKLMDTTTDDWEATTDYTKDEALSYTPPKRTIEYVKDALKAADEMDDFEEAKALRKELKAMQQEAREAAEAYQGFKAMDIRFFIYWFNDEEIPEIDLKEVTEADFIAAEGAISYERHTVFANGVNQICLTKDPYADI